MRIFDRLKHWAEGVRRDVAALEGIRGVQDAARKSKRFRHEQQRTPR